MLEEAQKEYQEGYKEVWDDGDISMDVNVSSGQYNDVKNLIYLDWNNYGPDYLDQFFDESKVILSEMFTRDGSGIDAGEIKEGKLADFILVDMNNQFLLPNSNLISNMIYAADSSCITDVFCDGKRFYDVGR